MYIKTLLKCHFEPVRQKFKSLRIYSVIKATVKHTFTYCYESTKLYGHCRGEFGHIKQDYVCIYPSMPKMTLLRIYSDNAAPIGKYTCMRWFRTALLIIVKPLKCPVMDIGWMKCDVCIEWNFTGGPEKGWRISSLWIDRERFLGDIFKAGGSQNVN